jgi:hypothetical protein
MYSTNLYQFKLIAISLMWIGCWLKKAWRKWEQSIVLVAMEEYKRRKENFTKPCNLFHASTSDILQGVKEGFNTLFPSLLSQWLCTLISLSIYVFYFIITLLNNQNTASTHRIDTIHWNKRLFCCSFFFKVGYLTMLSVWRLYIVSEDGMINEVRAVDRMKTCPSATLTTI